MSFKKCEALLKNYNNFKMGLELGNDEETKRIFSNLEKAIDFLGDEEFIGIITMHYFDKLTMECIAEIYDVSVVTVYAQKKKLVNKLASIIFSDDVIREILMHEETAN